MRRGSWKGITLDYDELAQGETALYELIPEQVNALLAMCEYLGWSTRWENPPPDVNLFAANTRYALMNPLDICALVADCILTNTDVQNAISNAGGTTAKRTIENTIYSNTDLVAENADANGCTDDARYGRIDALVDYIDAVQLDFYESIDAALNVLGEVSILVSAIPLFETLPFDELIQTIANSGEQWEDSYTASVNTQLLEDFKCQLWCDYADCSITIADVREKILERYNLSSTQGTLNALSLFTLFGRIVATIGPAGTTTYIGDDLVYVSWLLQILAVEATGQFFGVSIADYVGEAANGTPSGLWSGCGCAAICEEYDFSTGAQLGWTIRQLAPPDNRVIGELFSDGWAANTNNNSDNLQIISPTQTFDIRTVQIEFNGVFTGNNPTVSARNPASTVVYDTVAASNSVYNLSLPSGIVDVMIIADPDTGVSGSGWGTQRLTKITLCP